jgi:hypothetical protein
MRILDRVRWFFLLARVRRDPARFLERAAWHVEDPETASLLMVAARYAHAGKDVPKWLFLQFHR